MTSLLPSRGLELARALARLGRMDGLLPGRADSRSPGYGGFAGGVSRQRRQHRRQQHRRNDLGRSPRRLAAPAYESGHRGRRVVTSAETVTSALVMMGHLAVLFALEAQPIVVEWLGEKPEALPVCAACCIEPTGAPTSRWLSQFIASILDAAVIHAATAAATLSLPSSSCGATRRALALRIQRAQAADPESRPERRRAKRHPAYRAGRPAAQPRPSAWRLPALIADVAAEAQPAGHTSARIVALGARLARHSALGWDNAAIPDDVDEIATLLNLVARRDLHHGERYPGPRARTRRGHEAKNLGDDFWVIDHPHVRRRAQLAIVGACQSRRAGRKDDAVAAAPEAREKPAH